MPSLLQLLLLNSVAAQAGVGAVHPTLMALPANGGEDVEKPKLEQGRGRKRRVREGHQVGAGAGDEPKEKLLRHGFSIDGLLKSATEGAKPLKSAPVDYFMEEHELSWTDGRRFRKGSQKMDKMESTREDQAEADVKPVVEKQPPLPSSSLVASKPAKHVCGECGKSYATSSNLSRHKQTHRPLDSPHAKKCTYCDRIYVSMPALSMHLLTHQARHKCTVCGKLFSRPWLLKGHLRSHTGQKPFGCGNCGKAFSDRSNLRAHLNTHNNEKRWHCDQCGRAFALKSYLAKHIEQQHGDTVDYGRRSSSSSGACSGIHVGAVALPSLCDDDDEAQEAGGKPVDVV